MKKTKRLTLDEWTLEEKEKKYLEVIKSAFKTGDIDALKSSRRHALKNLRKRERRITRKLINAAKKENLIVNGNNIDLFEKELLKKHQELYELLSRIDFDTESLVDQALELEKSIIENVDALLLELNKTSDNKN
jgi:hypothetical protein